MFGSRTTRVLAIVAGIAAASVVHAKGTPQRPSDTPPGLERVLGAAVPGITRALVATEGSNSRLQDQPVSP